MVTDISVGGVLFGFSMAIICSLFGFAVKLLSSFINKI